jgi:phosphoribosylformylglycinamidine synthase
VAEGGFAVALAECCLADAIGARIDTGPSERAEELLFGEGPGGFVISGERAALEALDGEDLEVFVCGEVGGDRLTIAMQPAAIDVSLEAMREAHSGALAAFFG